MPPLPWNSNPLDIELTKIMIISPQLIRIFKERANVDIAPGTEYNAELIHVLLSIARSWELPPESEWFARKAVEAFKQAAENTASQFFQLS